MRGGGNHRWGEEFISIIEAQAEQTVKVAKGESAAGAAIQFGRALRRVPANQDRIKNSGGEGSKRERPSSEKKELVPYVWKEIGAART